MFARSEPSRGEAGEKRSRGLESESGVGDCCITWQQLSLAPQTPRYRTHKVQSLKATGSALYNSRCLTSLHCGSIYCGTVSAFTADLAPLKILTPHIHAGWGWKLILIIRQEHSIYMQAGPTELLQWLTSKQCYWQRRLILFFIILNHIPINIFGNHWIKTATDFNYIYNTNSQFYHVWFIQTW